MVAARLQVKLHNLAMGHLALGGRFGTDGEHRGPDRADMRDDERGLGTGCDRVERAPRARDLIGERLAAGKRELRVGRLERRVQVGRDRREVLERLPLPAAAV